MTKRNIIARIGALRLSASVFTVGVALYASAAFAQTSGSAEQERDATLEEIVVTAQKRAENLQKVPIAVTAFSAESIERRGIVDIQALGGLTPSVNFDKGGGPASGSRAVFSASIRGIGQNDFALNLEPGVGVYLDGVYLARTVGANLDLPDVARVEILKGPQGTLFGKNTIGGAVSVSTRDPGDKFMLRASATFGRFDRRDVEATVDIPLGDNLGLALTGASRQRDGWQRRIPAPGLPVGTTQDSPRFNNAGYRVSDTQGSQNQQMLRGKLVWDDGGTLKVTFSGDWSHSREDATPSSVVALTPELVTIPPGTVTIFGVYNSCVAASAVPAQLGLLCNLPIANLGVPLRGSGVRPLYSAAVVKTGDINTTYATGNNLSAFDSYGASLILDWNIADSAKLKSITAYRKLDWVSGFDTDGSAITMQELNFTINQEQISQEFQLTGSALSDKLKYTLGLYYFNESGNTKYFNVFGGGIFQPNVDTDIDTKSYAAYLHLTYSLTDALRAIVGARYSRDDKSLDGSQIDQSDFIFRSRGCPQPFNPATCPQLAAAVIFFPDSTNFQQYYPQGTLRQRFSQFLPNLGIQYDVARDVMAYASYSKGFKSGGWTTRLQAPTTVAPEFGPEEAETYEIGLKSELFGRRLRVNLAGFHTLYKDIQLNFNQGLSPVFQNAGNARINGFEAEVVAALGEELTLNGSVAYTDAKYTSLKSGLNSTLSCCITLDSKLPKTPEWKASIGPAFRFELDDGSLLRINSDLTYTSSMFNDSINSLPLKRKPTYVINGQIAYAFSQERFEIAFGMTNIFDARYIVAGGCNLSAGACAATYSDPAEWYVRLRAKF